MIFPFNFFFTHPVYKLDYDDKFIPWFISFQGKYIPSVGVRCTCTLGDIHIFNGTGAKS